LKGLYRDKHGVSLCCCRLNQGNYHWPERPCGSAILKQGELIYLLEGQEGAIWYLHQIGQLYKNEKYIQGEALDAATYRKEKSLPILREIRKRLEVENTTASGLKTELAKAISYTLSKCRSISLTFSRNFPT
jgi:hypothetical protein